MAQEHAPANKSRKADLGEITIGRAAWITPYIIPGEEKFFKEVFPKMQKLSFVNNFDFSQPLHRMPLVELDFPGLIDALIRASAASGLGAWHTQYLERLKQDITRQVKSLDSRGAEGDRRYFPPNWKGATYKDQKMEQLLLDEGFALAYVPTAEILDALLDTRSVDERRKVVLQKSEDIARACSELLSSLDNPRLQENVSFAKCITAAFLAGHVEAAQALAANLIDTMLC